MPRDGCFPVCVSPNQSISSAHPSAGDACRLTFDLGLHQDASNLSETTLTPLDIEARQMAFWGCFNLDRYVGIVRKTHHRQSSNRPRRLWSLYLGRPAFIKLSDISIRRPAPDSRTWDLRLMSAWVGLLDIAGRIADRLLVVMIISTTACCKC